jgi:hypothetical protein
VSLGLAELKRLLTPIAERLGYSEIDGFKELGGDGRLCYARRGAIFTTEALCFLVNRSPWSLMVDYVASPRSLAELQSIGLEGNALAESLFMAQHGLLGMDPQQILPATIHLGDGLPEAVEGVAREIEATDRLVWPLMREKWDRLGLGG